MSHQAQLWQVVCRLTKERAEVAANRCEDAGAVAVSIMDETPTWRVMALYAGEPSHADIAARLGSDDFTIERVGKRDWVAQSIADLPPLNAGRFVLAIPARAGEIKDGRIPIVIDAGQAFGTGHHGSTLGCLTALQRIARRPRYVLDLGTGSGVLAIAAAKLWRARVIAADIDPIAVATARQNIAQNDVRERIRTIKSDGTRSPALRGARFDLVLANILARPLARLAPRLIPHLACGGTLILGGLLEEQEPLVLAAYRHHGLALRRRTVIDGWATLSLTRPRR